MGSVKIDGNQERVEGVVFDDITFTSTGAHDAQIIGNRFDNNDVLLSQDNQFHNNWLASRVLVSTGSRGASIVGNHIERNSQWLIDKGQGTHYAANTVFCPLSTSVKSYDFSLASDYMIEGAETLSFTTDGALSTGAGTVRMYIPFACQIIDVRATISSLTSSTTEFVFDANVNGASLFTTTGRPTISTGTYDSGWTVANSTGSIWRATSTEYVTFDIDQVGTGSGLTGQVRLLPVSTR